MILEEDVLHQNLSQDDSAEPSLTAVKEYVSVNNTDEVVVVSDEDHADQPISKSDCAGIVPTFMKDDILNLFPFQLLPDLEIVVFW